MQLKLFYNPKSTFTRRVRIYLAEKGIELELESVSFEKLEHKKRDFLAKNPYGKLPCLQVDDDYLYESMSIIYFLEDVFGENPIIFSDPLLKAKADMAIRVFDTQVTGPATPLIFQRKSLPPEKWDIATLEKYRRSFERHLETVSKQLGDKEYFLGDCYSIVEIAYAPFFSSLPLLGLELPQNMQKWRDRIESRPSYINTKEQA